MKKIKKEDCIYSMSKDNKPVLKVHSGDTVVFETYDCYNDQIKSEDQPFSTIKRELNNPATGPLYINEAESGDILKIEIIDIKINDSAVMTLRPDSGVMGDSFYETKSKILPIRDNKVILNDKIQIPVNPMIGVIGVAPYDGEIKTTVPNSHGGNLDCKRIVKGSNVYLHVHTEGALLSIGDLHAVMADGEVVICGAEVSGEVTVKVDVIKGKALPLPMVVDKERIMTIASKKTLDEAAKTATIHMHKFLINELNMDTYEAGMLLSLVGDLRICQVVDPLMTARMELPKNILDKYNYKMV